MRFIGSDSTDGRPHRSQAFIEFDQATNGLDADIVISSQRSLVTSVSCFIVACTIVSLRSIVEHLNCVNNGCVILVGCHAINVLNYFPPKYSYHFNQIVFFFKKKRRRTTIFIQNCSFTF